ncbi:MAG: acyl carrier protein [Lentisphaerae bacterium]|nr:acyl carrier protein [Lentisphaerota bacterium]
MNDLMEELKQHIIQALKLKTVKPENIDPDAPLFGGGLGLDSIDALELVVMLERHYGIKIEEMEAARAAFASLRAMARFVTEKRVA